MYVKCSYSFFVTIIYKFNNIEYNVGGFKIVPNKIGLINVIDFKLKDK